MPVEIDTSGFERFLARIPGMLNAGAGAAAEATVGQAKDNVPVSNDPPHTRDTIRTVNIGTGQREVEAREAAIVIELGTRHMAARPFLMPAATSAETFEAFVDGAKGEL